MVRRRRQPARRGRLRPPRDPGHPAAVRRWRHRVLRPRLRRDVGRDVPEAGRARRPRRGDRALPAARPRRPRPHRTRRGALRRVGRPALARPEARRDLGGRLRPGDQRGRSLQTRGARPPPSPPGPARVPDDKFKDKLVTDMREYVCTAAEVAGYPVTYDAFRESFLGAADDAGVAIEERELTDIERGALKKIGNRIATDDSVRRVSSERFRADHTTARRRVGFGNHKGRKLCRAGVALDDTGTVVATMMAGDMHVSPPDTLDRIATALVGANASEDGDVHARIASVLESADVQQADATTGITTDDLHAAFRRAVDDAKEASP